MCFCNTLRLFYWQKYSCRLGLKSHSYRVLSESQFIFIIHTGSCLRLFTIGVLLLVFSLVDILVTKFFFVNKRVELLLMLQFPVGNRLMALLVCQCVYNKYNFSVISLHQTQLNESSLSLKNVFAWQIKSLKVCIVLYVTCVWSREIYKSKLWVTYFLKYPL